jgi:hypothetical protein
MDIVNGIDIKNEPEQIVDHDEESQQVLIKWIN